MLRVAEKRSGVTPCLSTADDFFAKSSTTPKCNKILINESAHLFGDPQETFRKAFEYLQEDGLLVLIQRSSSCSLPMWKDLAEVFAPLSVDALQEYLDRAGFKLTKAVEVGISRMTKRDWYDKMRRRMFTILSEFTDEDIEKGIKELDQSWFPEKDESDVVEIRDNLVFFTAKKQ